MKNVIIIKEIDGLGRIVIPKDIRDLFNFKREIEVVVTQEGVLIRSPKYVLVEKEQN